jgi:hypothetical protein
VRDRAFAAQVKVWAESAATLEVGSSPKLATAFPEPIPMGGAQAQSVAAEPPPEALPASAEEAAGVAEESTPQPRPAIEMATAPEFSLERSPLDEVKIETEFGGLFYLINLGIYLGYYGDFSTPEEPGIDLPIWDFLTLVGRRLLEEPPAEDPIWGMLARLVGRTPGSARVPLDPLLTRGDDLTGHSERPAGGPSADQGVRPTTNPEFEEPRWDGLDETMQRVTAWLAAGKLEGLVVMHSARVRLTATHLDVFLSLEELPVEIRIARLDRDPGWVPAAGRYIAFHFQ